MASVPDQSGGWRRAVPAPHQGGMFLERRRAPRVPVSGRAMAIISRSPVAGELAKVCALALKNLSVTGLGAVAESPVQIGSTLQVSVPATEMEPAFEASGRVVRCEPRPWGFELGLDFGRPCQRAAA